MNILYGAETEKALDILGRSQTPRCLIQAYGEVKLAAIRAQQETAHIYPDDFFPYLEKAALDTAEGRYDENFPLPLEQGGAGTSLHMNICEVLANAANGQFALNFPDSDFRVHPLNHIARFQSTNDTFPTAVIIMVYRFLDTIEAKITGLQEELTARETKYENVIITGRTELQDALPMTLGQVFSSWSGPAERDRWRFNKLKERLRTIPLGGTAIGTGFSAPRNYVFAAERHLRRITKLPLSRSQNLCDQVAHTDSLAECANGMALCADNLYKMANDMLLYTSGMCGEMRHEEVQYGSTIMPDKTNPVLLELIRGLCMETRALGALICDYSRSGQLQLNANLPFMASQFIKMDRALEKALDTAAEKLMPVLSINTKKMEADLVSSGAVINIFRGVMPYSKLKELLPLIKKAGITTKDELACFLEQNTDLDKETILQKLDTDNFTGFSMEN